MRPDAPTTNLPNVSIRISKVDASTSPLPVHGTQNFDSLLLKYLFESTHFVWVANSEAEMLPQHTFRVFVLHKQTQNLWRRAMRRESVSRVGDEVIRRKTQLKEE